MKLPEAASSDPFRRVLVVDDEPVVRGIIVMQLEMLGFLADEASSGEEAIRCFESNHYDFVVTDCNMPGISGQELALAIKQRSTSTPILMCSGHPPEARRAIDAVLRKPVSLVDLKNVIEGWMRDRLSSQGLPTVAPEAC